MANLFDTYTASPYVPAPFEAYNQAGQMQQKQYDTTQSQLQAQQDLLADMKVKPADVEYKNKLVQNIEAGAMDMLGKNKYYSPEMFQEVRSYIRKSARDPRFANLGAAYENYNKERAIEDKLRAEGKDYFFNHRKNYEATYDKDDNLMYNPSSEHLGIEERLDDTKTLLSLTGPMQAFTSKNKGYMGTQMINGKPMPIWNQNSVTSLLKSDKRVQKEVQDLVDPYLSTNEGRQWARLNAKGPDGKIDQSKVFMHVLNSVHEQYKNENMSTPMPGAAAWFDDDKPKTAMPFDPLIQDIYGMNRAKTSGQVLPGSPKYNSKEEVSFSPEKEQEINKKIGQEWIAFTKARDKGALEKRTKEEIDALNATKDRMAWYSGKTGGEQYLTGQEGFKEFTKDYMNAEKAKEFEASNLNKTEYTPFEWTASPTSQTALTKKLGTISPNNVMIYAGNNGLGKSLNSFVADKDDNTGLVIQNLLHNAKYLKSSNIKNKQGFSEPATIFEADINEELAKDLNLKESDYVIEGKGENKIYKMQFATPSYSLYDPQTAQQVAKESGLDIKGGEFQGYFGTVSQIHERLPAISSKVWKEAINNKLTIPEGNVQVDESTGLLIVPTIDPTTKSRGTQLMTISEFLMTNASR